MDDTNKYKIIQTVASGGTAVLFKAVQTSLDRIVAIKRLHQHLTGDENFTRRFILEAKAAASLDHENIVHVIDFGREGDCYQMVMEFVEGESLGDVLQRWRPIKSDLALAIVHQICLGLEHAHAKGIVHRDIKPGNVLLTRYGRVKIADFGLAKLTQSATSQTAANSILGTPLYMSPEQAFGESVDQRSDLFSLGTVLYELLTGRQPFADENYMGVIQNIIHKDIPSVRDLNADVPEVVERIVDRALHKNREHRYQSAREFRCDIEAHLGIAHLKETIESLGVLLDKTPGTYSVSDVTENQVRARRRKISPARVWGLAVFSLVAAASAVAIFRPDWVENYPPVRVRDERPAVQAADVASPRAAFDVAAFVPADSSAVLDDSVLPAPVGDSADAVTVGAAGDSTPDPGREKNAMPPSAAAERGDAVEAPTPAAAEKAPVQPSPRRGWLSISATPRAEVFVDGTYRGDAPPALSITLSSGGHKIECRNPRFETYTEVLKITTGELSRRQVALRKLRGTISLATQEGAELYVDGVLIGVTPVMKPIELDAGPHMLTIKKNGFHVWNSEVTVESKKVLPLRITLSPTY